ncbi:Hypothetical predicted protein [Podarcis lilfordi]|uniref:Uncharacterized protein n=1 Tax=Podarcis lilfordi TaxID=74358 RepID=A0AA35KDY9_9SAUR|nr:Hypothetical predicted protein [Podarcis lilfordi]
MLHAYTQIPDVEFVCLFSILFVFILIVVFFLIAVFLKNDGDLQIGDSLYQVSFYILETSRTLMCAYVNVLLSFKNADLFLKKHEVLYNFSFISKSLHTLYM